MASSGNNANIDKSVLLRQWLWPIRWVFWICAIALGAWVFGMLVQAAWAKDRAPDDPAAYQEQRLQVELETLTQLTPVIVQPMVIARTIGDKLRQVVDGITTLFARTLMNIPGKTRDLAASEFLRNHPDPGGAYAKELLRNAGTSWDLLLLSTYIFAVRTAMYTAMAPLLLLCLSLGFIDGAVAWAKRRANAGRESASIYHRAKSLATFVLITGYLVCLAVPDATEPLKYLAAISMLTGFAVRLQASFYKKYL